MFCVVFLIFILIIFTLVAISFFTLLEQKILGSIQLRKGPYYVGLLGILQPFSDAVKLFSINYNIYFDLNLFIINFSSIFILYLSIRLWALNPNIFFSFFFSFRALFFLLILGLVTIPLLIISWFSNCKYSLIGGLRTVRQLVSYEVSAAFCIMCFCCITLNLNILVIYEIICSFISIMILFIIWFPSILAESNRTPFDFSEGESELVSGFNTEVGGCPFALIFIREYLRFIYITIITRFFFFFKSIYIIFFCIFICFIGIISRGLLPRLRYDKLIHICWKSILPLRVFCFFYYYSLIF